MIESRFKTLQSRTVVLATTFLLAVGSVNARPPEARAGLTGNVAATGALLIMLGAAAGLAVAPSLQDGGPRSRVAAFVTGFGGFVAIIVGVILLDDNHSSNLAFAPVSGRDALAAGLDAEEMQAFNSNVPELNSILESINSDLLNAGESPSVALVNRKFDEYGAGLPSAALSASRKISAHAAQMIEEHGSDRNR